MSVCFRYTNNKEDAVEIVNDGFLKIFKAIYHYEASFAEMTTSFTGWVKKIMIHTAIDRFRKDKKLQEVQDLGNHSGDIIYDGEDVFDKISHDEIMKAVQNLSAGYRLVFNLYVMDGLTHKEISEHLNIAEGTSKSNLAKARKVLQRDLSLSYLTYK